MKLKKFKNLLFTFIICLFGALAFNSVKTNAVNLIGDITANEGDTYYFDYNLSTQRTIDIFAHSNFSPNGSTSQKSISFTMSAPSSSVTYIGYYGGCVLTSYTSGVSMTFTCSDRYIGDTGYSNMRYDSAFVSTLYLHQVNNEWVIDFEGNDGYNVTNFRFISVANIDYTNGYNAGYNVGYIFGENHNLVPSSCTYNVDILQGDCSNDYLVSGGVVNFDEINDTANSYGSNFLITFTFDNLVPVDDYFIKWHSYGGATISFYKNNSIIYAIDTRGLGDYGNVYTFRTPDSFDKVVINNVNYDYSIYSFGYVNSDSYELGYDEGELIGTNTGYDIGFDTGYDIGYSQGSESRNTLVGMVGAIFTGPVTMFQQIFNFNVLGINFAEMLLGLVTLLVVIWLIKKFI